MMKLETYDEVKKHLLKQKNRNLSLLIGNGFSISYAPDIFSYNALSKFIEDNQDRDLKSLFDIIKTSNFEQIMSELDLFIKILNVFDPDSQLEKKIDSLSSKLKTMLIKAVEDSHPECVFSIPQDCIDACAAFLDTYTQKEKKGKIFSTNYDLLLYWVLMRSNNSNCIDGFGRDKEESQENVPYEEADYSELRWGKHKGNQNIFYLHGALHLFDMNHEIIKQEYDGQYLLDKIKNLMNKDVYPIFVTAGNGDDKLNHIMHNYYLAYCYDALTKIDGSLVTYGFNFGEYDEHIIRAINKAANQGKSNCLRSVYIGVYSEADKQHIESIADKFKCKVHIFDSKTAKIWEK